MLTTRPFGDLPVTRRDVIPSGVAQNVVRNVISVFEVFAVLAYDYTQLGLSVSCRQLFAMTSDQ